MKKVITLITLAFVFIACNDAKKEKVEKPEVKKENIAADYKNIEVEIDGMTCEIGCARTIQSKLSKVNGVTFSKVDFESKTGQFTYDANTISEDEIVAKIDGIAGGGLYTVKNTKPISEIKKDSIS